MESLFFVFERDKVFYFLVGGRQIYGCKVRRDVIFV